MLDEMLTSFEVRCGFSPERPILVGFASADDFKDLTKAGQQFHDVGAGPLHGEFTHRIQWFIAMSEITKGTFAGPQNPFTHTPVELYQASMSEAYAVDVGTASPTGKAYMWDWVFDRIAGLKPTSGGGDYEPSRDAWTHPGEHNAEGALSNDIISGRLPDLKALKKLRKAQIAGHVSNKARMGQWFQVATDLRMAEGAAVSGGPSYFQQRLIPSPEAMKELHRIKEFAAGLIDRAKQWASLATISLSPEVTDASIPNLKKIHDDAAVWWKSLRESLAAARGSSKLAEAMVDAWFTALSHALAQTQWETSEITKAGNTDKALLGPILRKLNTDLTALTQQPSWQVVT